MTIPAKGKENYLGDGLYVSFDGWSIILRAPRAGEDHFVALEPGVWQNLNKWMNQFIRLKQHMEHQ